MKKFLEIIFSQKSLSREQAFQAMNMIMQGEPSHEEMAAFLGGLRGKGESSEELIGFAESLRAHSDSLSGIKRTLIDTCGTGGDGYQTFNISTTCAFIAAAAGLGVVKHGNRAQSSKCGSADVLEALGIKIDSSPSDLVKSIDEHGFGFLFAPRFHPAMKHVAPVRKKLGVRTVFNLLGPMVNPAKTKRQFMGVYDAKLLEPIGLALKELGSSSLVLVSGLDGMDEISLCAPSRIFHLKFDTQTHLTIKPEDFGFKRCEPSDLQGGSARDNADIMIEILEGKEKGPKRDIVLLNSAAALVAGDVSESLKDGLGLAKSLLDSGKAMNVLQSMRLK